MQQSEQQTREQQQKDQQAQQQGKSGSQQDSRFTPPVEMDSSSTDLSSQFQVKFSEVEQLLHNLLPDNRERSQALTKIEESFHWVQRAVTAAQNNRNPGRR